MKRILSALLICVLVVTMSTTMVFAADINYSFTADKTELVPGDVVTLTLKLDTNPGLAYYKNIVSFDATAFERTTITYTNTDDEEVTEEIKSSWGAPTVNDAQSGKTVMTWSNSSNKTGKTMLTMCYIVKDTAVNGTYSFKVDCEEAKNASFELLTIASSTTADITISGGVEPGQGGGNTVTATAAGTAGDITAYTIANDAAGDVDATEKVITKTFEGLTITDATRVYVTIDGEDRVFGSDLAEATNGLEIGKLTFGIIVDADVDLAKVTEFDVR